MCADKSNYAGRCDQSGFSLVELMVAIVISMLVALAALGAAKSFMTAQRQSTAIGTAYANGLAAAAAMKFEASHAGLGLFVDGIMPCRATNLSVNDLVHSEAASILPVSVTSTATDKTTLTVAYATALEGGTPGFLKEDAGSTSTRVEIKNYLPVSAGQTVVIAPPAAVGGTCTVRTVTSVEPPDATHGMRLHFANTGTHNKVNFASTVDYPANSQVFVLGQLRMTRFTLKDGALLMERPLEGSTAVPLARDVVAFSAQYGVTDGTSESLSSWEAPAGDWLVLDELKIQRIKAVRLGLVVRASQREKAAADSNCTATSEQPVLFGGALSLAGDWQCFKYRVVTVVVPLRNMMLGVDAS